MPDQPTPSHRTTAIAGLRALADFLETRPEVPLGSYVSDAEKIAEVRRIAEVLGVDAQIWEDGTGIVAPYQVAGRTTFTVHAHLTPAGEQA
jgi:hypothetical protein